LNSRRRRHGDTLTAGAGAGASVTAGAGAGVASGQSPGGKGRPAAKFERLGLRETVTLTFRLGARVVALRFGLHCKFMPLTLLVP
jgi:hypothetical protein